MEIRSEVVDGVALYRIAGRIDAVTGPDLQSAVSSAIGGGSPRIIFDMREVTYISSAGLRVIVLSAKQAKAANGGFAVFGLQAAVSEVFDVAGFRSIIPIVSSEADARSTLGA